MNFDLEDSVRYFCFGEAADMRKGIHSLYMLIKTHSKRSAISGDAYVFLSASRKSIKILRWHKDGFLLYHKKLELGSFILPMQKDDDLFFELQSRDFNHMISSVKYRSIGNELKRSAILTV